MRFFPANRRENEPGGKAVEAMYLLLLLIFAMSIGMGLFGLEEPPQSPIPAVYTDPRDEDQCLAQPDLYWCRRACADDPNWSGCHAS